MSGIKQEAETVFFGSGVQELYGHWRSEIPGHGSLFRRHGEWEPGQAPDGWAYRITVTDPFDCERLMDRVITYSVLYTAAEMISAEQIDASKPFHPVSAETDRACAAWVYTDEVNSFDPHTLDEVLQVVVFGGLLHSHFEYRD